MCKKLYVCKSFKWITVNRNSNFRNKNLCSLAHRSRFTLWLVLFCIRFHFLCMQNIILNFNVYKLAPFKYIIYTGIAYFEYRVWQVKMEDIFPTELNLDCLLGKTVWREMHIFCFAFEWCIWKMALYSTHYWQICNRKHSWFDSHDNVLTSMFVCVRLPKKTETIIQPTTKLMPESRKNWN